MKRNLAPNALVICRGLYFVSMERKMNKADKLLLVGIKHDLANGYRSFKKCYVCHCEKSHSGMTFHHLWYLKG
jgi:cytochrome c2